MEKINSTIDKEQMASAQKNSLKANELSKIASSQQNSQGVSESLLEKALEICINDTLKKIAIPNIHFVHKRVQANENHICNSNLPNENLKCYNNGNIIQNINENENNEFRTTDIAFKNIMKSRPFIDKDLKTNEKIISSENNSMVETISKENEISSSCKTESTMIDKHNFMNKSKIKIKNFDQKVKLSPFDSTQCKNIEKPNTSISENKEYTEQEKSLYHLQLQRVNTFQNNLRRLHDINELKPHRTSDKSYTKSSNLFTDKNSSLFKNHKIKDVKDETKNSKIISFGSDSEKPRKRGRPKKLDKNADEKNSINIKCKRKNLVQQEILNDKKRLQKNKETKTKDKTDPVLRRIRGRPRKGYLEMLSDNGELKRKVGRPFKSLYTMVEALQNAINRLDDKTVIVEGSGKAVKTSELKDKILKCKSGNKNIKSHGESNLQITATSKKNGDKKDECNIDLINEQSHNLICKINVKAIDELNLHKSQEAFLIDNECTKENDFVQIKDVTSKNKDENLLTSQSEIMKQSQLEFSFPDSSDISRLSNPLPSCLVKRNCKIKKKKVNPFYINSISKTIQFENPFPIEMQNSKIVQKYNRQFFKSYVKINKVKNIIDNFSIEEWEKKCNDKINRKKKSRQQEQLKFVRFHEIVEVFGDIDSEFSSDFESEEQDNLYAEIRNDIESNNFQENNENTDNQQNLNSSENQNIDSDDCISFFDTNNVET